jgi:hypothetical protein
MANDSCQFGSKILEQSFAVDGRHGIADKRYQAIPAIRKNNLRNISRYKENNTKKFAAHDANNKG